jgi:hypothetical protein
VSDVWDKAKAAILNNMKPACDECSDAYDEGRHFIHNAQVRKELRTKGNNCLYEIKVSIERIEP